jgi:sulfate adenylyltransferase subunit 2
LVTLPQNSLEAEAIAILREAAVAAKKPVLMYSVGKDSSVLLHLCRKAFYPGAIPFPVMHIDTLWKFKEMYAFRLRMMDELGLNLISYTNPQGISENINPFIHGSGYHTDLMKTVALKQALDQYEFDLVIGGARRDEEKSRAKERIFSFRASGHLWDPKLQRPELWSLFNTHIHAGESMRVFPLSNWTELSVWQYILQENIPIVPLYFAKPRPVVERNGQFLMVDDERFIFLEGEKPVEKMVRFRTLGCYPLTAALESEADTLAKIVAEVAQSTLSERQGRLIDSDSTGSMEKKKKEGYF